MYLLAFSCLAKHAVAADKSFDGITCQSNIHSALIGRYMRNEPVRGTEARYEKIGLKLRGAFGMEDQGDPWTLVSWEICGRSFDLLYRRNIVKDVLEYRSVPGSPGSQIASCTVDGKALPEVALMFDSTHAWRIDDKAVKFAKITGDEIVCVPDSAIPIQHKGSH